MSQNSPVSDRIQQYLGATSPFMRFYSHEVFSRFMGDPNVSNFAVGNPQEMPLPAFGQILQKWSEPQMMAINDPNAWNSTPAFSADDRTLYFASSREGGFGGADLYSATVNSRGRWGNVRNLGPRINTSGDEM